MKLIPIGFAVIVLIVLLSTCTSPKSVISEQEIPKTTQEGRLEIANIIDVKIRSNKVSLSCDIYNTGRFDLNLPDLSDKIEVVISDETLKEAQLTPYKEDFIKGIKSLHESINVGKFKFKQKLSFNISSTTPPEEVPVPFFGNASYEDNTAYIDEKHCADLILDSVYVIKRSKNWARIGFVVKNQGKGPAQLFQKGYDIYNNLSIKYYLSRSHRLTRGSVLIGESFLERNKSNNNGILNPGETYVGKARLDLVKYTKFTPTLIFSIDEYNKIRECDETNNTNATSIAR